MTELNADEVKIKALAPRPLALDAFSVDAEYKGIRWAMILVAAGLILTLVIVTYINFHTGTIH